MISDIIQRWYISYSKMQSSVQKRVVLSVQRSAERRIDGIVRIGGRLPLMEHVVGKSGNQYNWSAGELLIRILLVQTIPSALDTAITAMAIDKVRDTSTSQVRAVIDNMEAQLHRFMVWC